MIDFHCHLDLYPDSKSLIAQCVERGVYVLSVTTTPSAWEGTLALSEEATRIRTSLGLHPQLAGQRRGELSVFERHLPNARYVGEIGLDGSPDFRSFWSAQLDVFERILFLCGSAGGRVMTIHSRRAVTPVLDALEAHPEAGVPILHWFSGTAKELDRATELGCWFSVGPAMLRGEKGRRLAERMPSHRVLTETDGPFAQVDGRSATPFDVASAVCVLASVWKTSEADATDRLHANLRSMLEHPVGSTKDRG